MSRLIAGLALLASLTACGQLPDAPMTAGTAEIGVSYRYVLYDHCGLDTVPIEFDGSEWQIDGPTSDGNGNPPLGFGNPEDVGVVTIHSQDTGTYRSSGGVERRIVRVRPIQPEPSPYAGCI